MFKKILISIIAIVLVAAIGIGAYFMFFIERPTKIEIASRKTIIDYFDNNGVTEYLNQKLGVDIQWLDYGDDSEAILQKLMENAGKGEDETPDAYLGLGIYGSDFESIAPDVYLDITNDALTQTVEYKKLLENYTDKIETLKVNGKLYSFPNLFQNYSSEYPQKVWINSEWLKAVDAEAPTSIDDFYNLLKKFKNEDPNGNEEADEIPLAAISSDHYSLGFIINAFLPSSYDLTENSEFINIEDGQVYSPVNQDEYKEALKFIKKLIDEGLLSEDFFSADKTKLSQGNISSEKIGVLPASDINTIFDNVERSGNYIPLGPLAGSDGKKSTVVKETLLKNGAYSISRNAKGDNLDLALKIGDALLAQEGTLTVLFGKEGEGWNLTDGSVISMGGTGATWKVVEGATYNHLDVVNYVPIWYGKDVSLSKQAAADSNGNVSLQTADNWPGYLNQVTSEIYESVGSTVRNNFINKEIVFSVEDEAELSVDGIDLRPELAQYIYESAKDFVLGNADIDDGWDNYLETLESKGLSKLINLYQTAYNSN